MTFVVRSSGDRSATIVCVYTCPRHGEFDAEVNRDESGSAPDFADCGSLGCQLKATWTPVAISCRVRRVEVVRGKYEKPERKTYLDTTDLGEGQSDEEFRAQRRKIWREHRMDGSRKEFLNK